MDLKPKYLTFEEYQYMGGSLDWATFRLLEFRAEHEINRYTFNRLNGISEYPNEVKLCVFDLIPLLSDENSIYSNEHIGNYSVTKKDKKERTKDIKEIITSYLIHIEVNNVPILYIGADEN